MCNLITYPTSLEDCHNYADTGHGQDDHSIVVIVVGNPETKTKQLEDVEWIKDLETE